MKANLLLEQWLNELKINYEKEKPFYPENDHRKRKMPYHFDYFLPDTNTVIEIDGAVCKGYTGGHTSIIGYQRGCVKQFYAVNAGYAYIQFPAHWFTENVEKAFRMSPQSIYAWLKDLKENPDYWRNLRKGNL